MSATLDRKLRSILLREGRLEDAVLQEAMQQTEKEHASLTSVLCARRLIGEKEIIGLVAKEIRRPPIDLGNYEIDPALADELSQEMAADHGVVPISKVGNVLTIAVSDPFDVFKLDDLKNLTELQLRPVVSTAEAIHRAFEALYNPGQEKMSALFEGAVREDSVDVKEVRDDDEATDFTTLSEEGSPIVRLVNLLIYQAVKLRASDIHIEPFERKISVRYRQDGMLREAFSPPKRMMNALASRIKIMAQLDIAEKRRPQDGKFRIILDGRNIDFRVSSLPTVYGEKIVMRILDTSHLALTLEGLGFEPKALEDYRRAVKSPYGMILITGPTGSGKSTSLYAAVREIVSPEENFVTVEDPVEYKMDGVNQVNVNVKRGLTFAVALRSILRQDPDKVMIGEIRDTETIEIAVKAALTGHLVLSTLHTNDAASTVTRMVDMGVDPFMISSSTLLIAAQRLVRKLCEFCREPIETPPRERLLELSFLEAEAAARDFTLYRAVGCNKCAGGYRGRFALLETLPITEGIKRLILRGSSALEIKDEAVKEGMLTLRRCGVLNAMRGVTSLEEVVRVTLAD
ncbi:MAG: Flp pilus assembly complex ATPase component TadA [Planctomycetes bacterium]|nr:Flp pilus assembly complex ATPase component TadA [Planctomycetota bacterium]